MWVDARQQPTFAAALLPHNADLPAAVLLAPRKLRYSRLQGPFTQEALSMFINRVASAQLATSPLSEMPQLVAGGERAAAGQDVDAEEEFDLADIMGTKVATNDADRQADLRTVRCCFGTLLALMWFKSGPPFPSLADAGDM